VRAVTIVDAEDRVTVYGWKALVGDWLFHGRIRSNDSWLHARFHLR